MVYSSSVERSDSLRLFRNGLLQYGSLQSQKQFLPFGDTDSLCQRGSVSTKCFQAGDGRLSEQPALITLHIIFLRLHNSLAMKLASVNSHWSDEKLYQEARRIVGALVQLITYREYLPIILGQDILKIFDLVIEREGYYKGYNETVNPTIANSFSTAAYRFGHSLVQEAFVRVDEQHRPIFDNVTIHNEFNNHENLHSAGSIDRLLLGLTNQPCQRRDEFLTSELTNHLFQTPSFNFGMDLASINIQRGRDHGIPSYTDWRSICGLTQVIRWSDFERVTSISAARKFRSIYSSVKDIDLFSAGLAEKPVRGGLIGPTFACIIAQQFSNLRKGDRFWFENDNQENSFIPRQLSWIKNITFAQILCYTTDKIQTIQPFVFLTPDELKNKRLACDDENIDRFDLQAWAEKFEDRGNELQIKNDLTHQRMRTISSKNSPDMDDRKSPNINSDRTNEKLQKLGSSDENFEKKVSSKRPLTSIKRIYEHSIMSNDQQNVISPSVKKSAMIPPITYLNSEQGNSQYKIFSHESSRFATFKRIAHSPETEVYIPRNLYDPDNPNSSNYDFTHKN